MVLTGRVIEAAEALNVGLVQGVVPPGDAFKEALASAEKVAANAPLAVRGAKKVIDAGVHLSRGDALLLSTELYEATVYAGERHEGVAAFNEKRVPVFAPFSLSRRSATPYPSGARKMSTRSARYSTRTGGGVDEQKELHDAIRESVRALCKNYHGEYWRGLEQRPHGESQYPTEFVEHMQRDGLLSILIPEEYGGGGQSLRTATVVLEEVHRSGCNAGAAHAQMYTMGSLLHSGSPAQKAEWLPKIAAGEIRLQAFGVSEPNSGTDTLSLETTATRDGDDYIINGQKMWTSRAMHSDAMLLLARTDSPEPSRDNPKARANALTLFIVDMRGKVNSGNGIDITPVQTMMNHSTTTIFFDGLRVPAANIIGGLGNGFKTVLGAMNAERVLIASECIGDGRFFIDRATRYANDRTVFGRPIGANQGVSFPIAAAYAELEAAALMVNHAADCIDQGKPSGEQANLAKYLAAEASVSWLCVQCAP